MMTVKAPLSGQSNSNMAAAITIHSTRFGA